MPIGIGAAIVGGSIVSGLIGKNASDNAADAARGASEGSIAEQRRQFDTVRGDTAPYRDVGQAALYRLSDMYGLPRARPQPTAVAPQVTQTGGGGSALGPMIRAANPMLAFAPDGVTRSLPFGGGGTIASIDVNPALHSSMMVPGGSPAFNERTGTSNPVALNAPSPDQVPVQPMNGQSVADTVLQSSPGYQFRLSEGMKALDRNQSKYRFTPRAAKEMERYSQGYASNEFNNFIESQFRLAGIGGNAVNTSAGAGANAANSISNANISAGNAAGGAAIAGASSINNAIQGGMNNYITLQALQRYNNTAYSPKLPAFEGIY